MLLDHGHPRASLYPIWKVSAEAGIVVRRLNAQLATEISFLQMALSTMPNMSVKASATKNAAKELQKQLKGLIDGGP